MPIPLPRDISKPLLPLPRSPSLLDEMRSELVNGLHMGRLHAGDRLPSIRRVARHRGVDHRAVGEAYRRLEEEGFVEVKERSGVYVKTSLLAGSVELSARVKWVAATLAEAWRRDIGYPDLAALTTICSDASRLRCVCVESNRDQMLAYTYEIEKATGMPVIPLYVGADDREGVSDPETRRGLAEALENADIVVSTHYHAPAVRAVMGTLDLPFVILTVNPTLADAVRKRLRGAGLKVVSASAEFGERLRLMYSDVIRRPEQLRVFVAGQTRASIRVSEGEPILLTRAALELVPELAKLEVIFPHSPTLSSATIEALTEAIVEKNMRRHLMSVVAQA